MKSTGKHLTVSLAALATAAALTACGGSGEGSSDEKKSVTMWTYPVIADKAASDAYWGKVEKDFEAANADIDVKLEHQPWEKRDEKVATAFAGKQAPDLLIMIPDQIPQYVKNGSLAPVEKAVEAEKDKFLPNALTGLSVDGKLYGAPIYHTVTSTLYNKKLLDKAGISAPPQTWDEVKAAAPKLKAAGVAALDYSGSPEATLNLNFYPLLWQAGGSVFAPDGKSVAFNQAPGLEALTFVKSLLDAGGVPKSAPTKANIVVDAPLGKQEVAMGYNNTAADAKAVTATWGAANVVVGAPLKGKKQVTFGIPGSLVLNAASKNSDAALKFVTFMTQPAQVEALGTASGFLSPRTDVTIPAKDEQAKKYTEALQYAFPGEPNVSSRQVMSLLAVEIQAALTGKKTPQQALDDAAEQANDLLTRQR